MYNIYWFENKLCIDIGQIIHEEKIFFPMSESQTDAVFKAKNKEIVSSSPA